MTVETVLIIGIIILLFLIYKKLGSLVEYFDEKNTDEKYYESKKRQEDMNFQNWLSIKLKKVEKKVEELSDVATAENPAWGPNSASSLKNENLINLYSQHLVEKQGLSQKDARTKACFVVNNFEGGVIEDISRDIRFRAQAKSEEELLSSDFFKKDVQEKISTLKANEIFEPLWIGIKIGKYQKGVTLSQNTRKAFEAYSGQNGYKDYVEDFAIVSKLVHLGIFEEKIEKNEVRKTMSGNPFYILKEDNLEKLRRIIFAGDNQNGEYYSDAYFESRHTKDERIKLPFETPFPF